MPARKPAPNPLTALWLRIPAYLRNKYILTVMGFVLLMVFVDKHDMGTQFRLHRTVNRLEEDLQRYDRLTAEAEAVKLDMEQNRERFARENYYMQQDDEDVFIIVDK